MKQEQSNPCLLCIRQGQALETQAVFKACDPFHLSAKQLPHAQAGSFSWLGSHCAMQGKEAVGVSQGLFGDRKCIWDRNIFGTEIAQVVKEKNLVKIFEVAMKISVSQFLLPFQKCPSPFLALQIQQQTCPWTFLIPWLERYHLHSKCETH